MHKKWFLVLASATAGASLFLLPELTHFFVFSFLLPIFFGSLIGYRLSFREGFVWGLLFFGSSLLGILVLLHESAEGTWRYLGYGFLVIYFALYTSLWFGASDYLINFFSIKNVYKRAAVWFITSGIYFFLVHYYSLFIFGQEQGYALGNPLVAAAINPMMQNILPIIGTMGAWCALVAVQLALSLLLTKMKRAMVAIFILILYQFITAGGWWGREPYGASLPPYLNSLGYLCAPPGEHEYPWDIAQEISHQLFDLRQRHPEVSIILMPESSCKFALNKYPRIIQSWIDTVLHEDCILCIGSHRQDENQLFNCLYCINIGPIIFTYDKQQPIPFGEYIPYPWNKIKSVEQLFLNNKKSFKAGCTCASFTLPQFTCIPQICYELYFCSSDPGKNLAKNVPVLAVTNDAWYGKTPHFQRFLLLLARYRALEWGRPIMYIAHTGGWWLEPHGKMVELKN
jgi:apolipoprotein N-acyltransferase